ncbi:MAG: hypothetical protein RLZZ519_40 [Bacteroidota bacterium]|jgi:hypothetical protein
MAKKLHASEAGDFCNNPGTINSHCPDLPGSGEIDENMKTESKFQAGDVVFAKVAPAKLLVVRRYVDYIYFCKIQDDPDHKDLVYFERELDTQAAAGI